MTFRRLLTVLCVNLFWCNTTLALQGFIEYCIAGVEQEAIVEWLVHFNTTREKLQPTDFACNVVPSDSPPQTAHDVRPSDINVIAAFGDSITSGIGIGVLDHNDVQLENRGESWSIGGDLSLEDGVITLANIFRKFNSNLKGYSVNSSSVSEKEAWLNVAVPGNCVSHIPDQADDLLLKLHNDSRIDWDNDWKLATLLIGGNDLCGYCNDREGLSPARYAAHIQEALDKLNARVPRMIVQLVPMFDVTPLREVSTGIVCDRIQACLCSCALNDITRSELRQVQLGYYEVMKELAEGGRYDTRDDFTVVLQPYLRDMFPPRLDKSFFSQDCFHPDRQAHQTMAIGLWNTMLVPVGQKPFDYPLNEEPRYDCPTEERPYIFTNKNSAGVQLSTIPPTEVPSESDQDSRPQPGFTRNHAIITGVLGVAAVVGITVGLTLLIVKKKHRTLANPQEVVTKNPTFTILDS